MSKPVGGFVVKLEPARANGHLPGVGYLVAKFSESRAVSILIPAFVVLQRIRPQLLTAELIHRKLVKAGA